MRRRRLLALPVLLFALSACGASTLSADEVATKSEDLLEDQVGARPDVECPDDLPVEAGAETRCVLTAEGDHTEYGVTVRISEVDGDTANLQVEVDEQPLG